MIEFKVNNKTITIFNEEIIKTEKVPIVIYNSFSDNGSDLWHTCLKIGCNNFILVNISNLNWHAEMTPWNCPPLFKNDNIYEGQADNYLKELTDIIIPRLEEKLKYKPSYYALAGYSLGGLFAIYSMYKTDIFKRIISCSGSFWYPNFLEYIKTTKPLNRIDKIYLSLGDKEKNSKNQTLATVEDKTLELVNHLKSQNINLKFEFNEGNHFQDNYLRIAKGLKWLI